MTESELQDICCRICECDKIDYMHIPNESGTADRRALGMRKGVPDLILLDKSLMFVELKRNERLRASEAQSEFLSTLKKYGVTGRVVGSEAQFRRTIKLVTKERQRSRIGVFLDYRYMYEGSPMERVHKFYMEKQGDYEPLELFAIKLFSNQNRKFPWLCNIKEHYFVATQTSTVTSKLLLAGWDVIFI